MPSASLQTLPALSVVTTTDPTAGHLGELLNRLSRLATERNEWFEVVVVDDLKLWPSAHQALLDTRPGLQLRPLWYPEHRGQLAAMLAGINLATADRVFTTDPDMFACVGELPAMLEELQENTALIHGIRPNRKDIGPLRLLGSRLANATVRAITGVKVSDLGSPVTLLRPSLVATAMGEANRLPNPRLFLYARLGPALRTFKLAGSAPPGTPSQYRLFTLITLFFQLVQDSIAVRHKLSAMETKPSR